MLCNRWLRAYDIIQFQKIVGLPLGLPTGQNGARYPSGKGEVCKTFMRRFDSDPRLQIPSPVTFSQPC